MTYENFTTEDLDNEEWRDIPEWNKYQISNLGRVRRQLKHRHKISQYWLTPRQFCAVQLRQNGRKGIFFLHRLVVLTFLERTLTHKHKVTHINGIRNDNRLINLRCITTQDNEQDTGFTGTELKNETWKPIQDFEHYLVSNLGRTQRDGIMIGHLTPRGYRIVALGSGRKTTKRAFVHRLVLQAFVGPVPAGHQVNHKNGIKHDNRVTNLEYVTPKENIHHAQQFLGWGTSRPHAHKIHIIQVHVIRYLLSHGHSCTEIAKLFHVSITTIWAIKHNVCWKGV